MDNKILHVTDTIEPQVKYRGSVKVLYMDKHSGKTKILRKHNSGGPGLFTAICRMLVGLDANDFVPSYIYAYSNRDGGGKQLFSQKITYASTPVLYKSVEDSDIIAETAELANIVQYTFMIPATSLKSRTDQIKCLMLYNSRNEICAKINFDDIEAIETAVGSNILIYWKLKFE